MRLLVIEDDKETAYAIKEVLIDNYVVELAFTGAEGYEKALANEYDLITLDLNLPDINGLEVCKKIRSKGIITPILMLTGQDEISTKVAGLDYGADDYLLKPFNFEELMARIRVLLRRNHPHHMTNTLHVGNLTLDLTKKVVKRGNRSIPLRRKELSLLEYLMRNRGKVITREMILNHVWASIEDPSTNTIDVHIKYLRDQIDKPFVKKLIKTVHGLGYKIES
ncbi:MAG TPA: response regulator transcription factor [Patescibacteria group bacterium]